MTLMRAMSLVLLTGFRCVGRYDPAARRSSTSATFGAVPKLHDTVSMNRACRPDGPDLPAWSATCETDSCDRWQTSCRRHRREDDMAMQTHDIDPNLAGLP